jgi:hypothetical protein
LAIPPVIVFGLSIAFAAPSFLLAFSDVLFDQCRACGKDRRKREKQAADDRPEAGRDEPRQRRDLVPARLHFEPFCQFLVGLSDSAHHLPGVRAARRRRTRR